MEIKTIKGLEHRLYDSYDEFKAFQGNIILKDDWRDGNEGDWVYTDDHHVVQILKVSLFFITYYYFLYSCFGEFWVETI